MVTLVTQPGKGIQGHLYIWWPELLAVLTYTSFNLDTTDLYF